MITKKTILPLLYITTIIFTHAMEHDNNIPLAKEALKKLQWDQVKQTSEYADITRLDRRPSDPELRNAWRRLHNTHAFKKYIEISHSSISSVIPSMEIEEKI